MLAAIPLLSPFSYGPWSIGSARFAGAACEAAMPVTLKLAPQEEQEKTSADASIPSPQ